MLDEPTQQELVLNQKDLDIATCRGSGNGGQHRNKTDSAVQIKHIPSGIMVRCEAERSQHQNKELALKTLRAKLWKLKEEQVFLTQSHIRNNQIGSGCRGDKRRTIQAQNNIVKDDDGRVWRYQDYLKGKW